MRRPTSTHRLAGPHRPSALVAWAWLVAATVSVPAHAQNSPYYLQLGQNFDYDSNLFRTADRERRDLISTTSATVGLDQPIGRQRIFGSASVNRAVYKNNSELDHTGYNLTAGLDWEAASKLSGRLQLDSARSQARFENYGALGSVVRGSNTERATNVDVRVQYGGASILSVEALGNYTTVSYSATDFSSRDRNSRMFGGGLRWRPSGAWTFGFIARQTRGEYPDFGSVGGVSLSDDYDRTDLDLTAQWLASGSSSFGARLTHTREDHDLDSERDFDGLTGEIDWNYRLTGKLGLGVNVARETGSGSSSSLLPAASPPPPTPTPDPASASGYLTDSRLSNRLGLRLTWEATAKIRLAADAAYSRDRYDNQFVGGAPGGGSESGSTRRLGLNASWEPSRSWRLACGVAREERSSDLTVAGAAYGYDATTGYCGATLSLR